MSVTVNTSRLNRILRNLNGNTSKVVRAIAFTIEGKAKELAPVDTGALRASIYTKVRGGSTMPDVGGDAVRVDMPEPKSDTVVHVGPSVEYALAVEFGTARTPAQPFLTPAVHEVEQDAMNNADLWQEVVTDG